MSDTILTEQIGRVAVVSLNRPETLNCFNNELLAALAETLTALDADPEVRCVVITGSGRAFCAGGDLNVLMDCDSQEKSDENMEVANRAVLALFGMRTPTIAMVNGAAAGAGFNLALACDLIFASEKAKFIQSFVNVGIASDCGGHYLLERAVGRHLAKELMFTARPVTAEEGKTLGFINRVVSPEQLREVTLAFAAELAEKAPLALAASKQLLNRAGELTLAQVLEAEKAQQGPLLLSHDCKEGIAAFREMICSDTVAEREAALAKIQPMQQSDFEALYEAMEGCPVTIRFLDPPLHEFVPNTEEEIELLAKTQNKSVETIKNIIASLHEFNPMMGHRGCRLAVTYPEIAEMQTRAVIRAAINTKKAHPDWNVKPEIMIPLVCEVKELKYVKNVVVKTADEEIAASDVKVEYEVGTMIEIPRAALTADEIATEADFFCFGTNDLTQMTFGFSRDDAGKFLGSYYDSKIFESDPFARLDTTGVGKLMDMAVKLGRPVNPKLHVGICGEHGGDPTSVAFCHQIGLDYVSCSPFRVPIARLAAAQAAIADKKA